MITVKKRSFFDGFPRWESTWGPWYALQVYNLPKHQGSSLGAEQYTPGESLDVVYHQKSDFRAEISIFGDFG